jgi:hypothetical protein
MSVLTGDLLTELDRIDTLFPTAVTVTRTSEEDFKSRQVVVTLDDRRLGDLLWGDSVTIEVAPGTHRLRVHNTLVWKNVDFSVGPGEQAFFEVINRATAGTYLFLPIFGIGPLALTVKRMV